LYFILGNEAAVNYVPRKATAKIVSNSLCHQSDNATTMNNICIAGDPSGSSCIVSSMLFFKKRFFGLMNKLIYFQGDPGGPVNLKNADNSWTAIGIVSYKHFLGGCQNGSTLPRPFTRVNSYLNWIECVMSDGKWNNSSCSINESIAITNSPSTTQSVTNSSLQSTESVINISSVITSQTTAPTTKKSM